MPDLPPLPPLGERPPFAADGPRFDAALRGARRRTGAALAGASGVVALAVVLSVTTAGAGRTGLAPTGPGPSAPAPKAGKTYDPSAEESAVFASPPPTSGPDGPLEVSIELVTENPRAGQLVGYRVKVLRPYLGMHWFTVDFGDGRAQNGRGLVTNPSCKGVQYDVVHTEDVDQVIEHSYRGGGTFDVTVTAGHVSSCAKPKLSATDRIRVEVQPGDVASNGPAWPYAYFLRIAGRPSPAPGGGRSVRFTPPIGGDDDGWVSRARVDWGDGTWTDFNFGLDGCNGTATAWPHGHRVWDELVFHTYEQRGTYQVVLTIVSTGCDGQDPQEVMDVREFRV